MRNDSKFRKPTGVRIGLVYLLTRPNRTTEVGNSCVRHGFSLLSTTYMKVVLLNFFQFDELTLALAYIFLDKLDFPIL